jgi:hypothetical protein
VVFDNIKQKVFTRSQIRTLMIDLNKLRNQEFQALKDRAERIRREMERPDSELKDRTKTAPAEHLQEWFF